MLRKNFFILFIFLVVYNFGNNIIIDMKLITDESILEKSPSVISKLEEIKFYNYSGKGITLYLPYINFYVDLNTQVISSNFNLNNFLAMNSTHLSMLTEDRLKYELKNIKILEMEKKAKLFYQAITNEKILKEIENIYNEAKNIIKSSEFMKKQISNEDLLFKQLELKRKKYKQQKNILELQLKNVFFIKESDNIILNAKDYKEDIYNFDKNKFLKKDYLYDLPEVKVQLYKLKENKAEEISNFYRNNIPHISPYITINDFTNVETGIGISYDLNNFITIGIKGNLFYDFDKSRNIHSNISFNISLNNSKKYKFFNNSYIYTEKQIIDSEKLNITNIIYTIEQLEMELNIAKEYINILKHNKNYNNSQIEHLKYLLDKASYIEYYYSILNEYNYNIFKLEVREKNKKLREF
ncbi:hypothetical protein [Marinitoga litoralis]|uniref:hypothetical protein n=1 Tax=Marinitoga litoralis TaxID=570855 RepID=UPI00195FF963|nr:hypothetical protein [Marinitoga litoralis]MBM7559318.1 hypothetical protein [Marinitoga litoralis]